MTLTDSKFKPATGGWSRMIRFLFLGCLLASVLPGRAVVFDWNSPSVVWTPGALSMSFDFDPNNNNEDGSAKADVTITITGDTSFMQNGYPFDDTSITGGFGATQESLRININWADKDQSVTVTVTFHYKWGVEIADLYLLDVDADPVGSIYNWRDEIRNIKGNFQAGPDIAAKVTGSASNTVTGSGTLGAVVQGNGSVPGSNSQGNVLLDFGTNPLTSFQFTYGNDTKAKYPGSPPKDPTIQTIAIYDLSWKGRIPEYHPGLIGALSCILLTVGFAARRLLTARST
jgi:hypothetical protein